MAGSRRRCSPSPEFDHELVSLRSGSFIVSLCSCDELGLQRYGLFTVQDGPPSATTKATSVERVATSGPRIAPSLWPKERSAAEGSLGDQLRGPPGSLARVVTCCTDVASATVLAGCGTEL